MLCQPFIINVSEHFCTAMVKKTQRYVPKKYEFFGRSHLRYSIDEFCMMLNRCGWNQFYLLNNVNEIWNVLVMFLDKLAPIRKFEFKQVGAMINTACTLT